MIEELFREYREVTLKIINIIESDNYEDDKDINYLMNERQNILVSINNVDLPANEKKKVYCNLKNDELDLRLESLLKNSLINIKEDIKINRLRSKTTTAYANSMRKGNLFSRKV